MGWDAHAKVESEFIDGDYVPVNKKYRDQFKEDFLWVKEKAGSVDGFLDGAGLDCSACGKMLEKATGLSVWTEEVWSPWEMKANWDFKFAKDKAWAYWSARKFFESCVKLKIQIRFSY